MERMSLQQLRTELNSSTNRSAFLFDRGSKLSFRHLTTSLSTLSTCIKVVAEDINNLRQFLPLIEGFLSSRGCESARAGNAERESEGGDGGNSA